MNVRDTRETLLESRTSCYTGNALSHRCHATVLVSRDDFDEQLMQDIEIFQNVTAQMRAIP